MNMTQSNLHKMKSKIDHFFKNNHASQPCQTLFWILTVAALFPLSGCQKHEKENSQVVARVNKEEITVHQLNAATINSVNQPGSQAFDKNGLLNTLIENSLLKQALIKDYEHKPMVVQSLTNSLIAAYAEVYRNIFLNVAISPTNKQVDQYRQKHPELFEQRQLFEIIEITFNNRIALEEINFLAYQVNSLAQIKAWLKEHPLNTYHRTIFSTTEKLRPEFFQRSFSDTKGSIILFTDDDGYKRLQFATPVKAVPLTGKEAFMFARESVVKELRNEKLQQEISRLKAIAAIEVSTPR